jgi:hypothetical protein
MVPQAVRQCISGMAVGGLTALAILRIVSIMAIERLIVSVVVTVVLYQVALLLVELAFGHRRALLGGWFAGALIMMIGIAVLVPASRNWPANPAFSPVFLVSEAATRGLLVPSLRKRLSRRFNHD